MKFIAHVNVSLKDGVLDPQGQTVGRALLELGFDTIKKVATGKTFRLEVEASSEEEAKKIAARAASKLLANPVIEKYDIEVLK